MAKASKIDPILTKVLTRITRATPAAIKTARSHTSSSNTMLARLTNNNSSSNPTIKEVVTRAEVITPNNPITSSSSLTTVAEVTSPNLINPEVTHSTKVEAVHPIAAAVATKVVVVQAAVKEASTTHLKRCLRTQSYQRVRST